jgi:acylphosphatase
MGPETRRFSVRYQGLVQGVGFHATAQALAARHGVTGWVRNEPDGSVLLEVQGATAAVDAYLDAVRDAMAGCVRSESRAPVATINGETGFHVRR